MSTRIPPKLTKLDLENWNSYLLATRLLFDRLDRRLLEDAGLSLPDFILLARLGRAPDDGLRMSDLADAAVFSRSRISHAFTRLEKEGWVERRSCPSDRRGSYGVLAPLGQDKLEQAQPIHDETIQRYFTDSLDTNDIGAVRGFTDAMLEALGGTTNDDAC